MKLFYFSENTFFPQESVFWQFFGDLSCLTIDRKICGYQVFRPISTLQKWQRSQFSWWKPVVNTLSGSNTVSQLDRYKLYSL